MKNFVKYLLEQLTCLNKSSVIVFSDYNRQLRQVIGKASIFNRIWFLPRKHKVFNYKLEFSFSDVHKFNLLVNEYRQYFVDVKCDFFVMNTLPRTDIDRHAALVAASELESVQVVYLDHGDTGFSDPSSTWNWLHYANYFYATNTESANYIRKLRTEYNEDIVVLEWKRPLPNRKKAQNYILFAPGFYNGELFIGGVIDTLKYRFTETIIKQLNKFAIDKGLRVIYKTLRGSDESFNPRSKDKFNQYISVEYIDRGNFNSLLSKAKAFVTDCVSTPFYDAGDIGIPSLCLYSSAGIKLRQTVLDMFNNSIKICKSEEDVENELRSFFNNDFAYRYRPFIEHKECAMPWR